MCGYNGFSVFRRTIFINTFIHTLLQIFGFIHFYSLIHYPELDRNVNDTTFCLSRYEYSTTILTVIITLSFLTLYVLSFWFYYYNQLDVMNVVNAVTSMVGILLWETLDGIHMYIKNKVTNNVSRLVIVFTGMEFFFFILSCIFTQMFCCTYRIKNKVKIGMRYDNRVIHSERI